MSKPPDSSRMVEFTIHPLIAAWAYPMGHGGQEILFKESHRKYRVFNLAPTPLDIHQFAPPTHSQQIAAARVTSIEQRHRRPLLSARQSRLDAKASGVAWFDDQIQETATRWRITANRQRNSPIGLQYASKQPLEENGTGGVRHAQQGRLA
jgi:hypothetical protein